LLEMRAFEMPPHARMSLTQQLLLRAMVARFWRKPYAPETLVRWGTELHDRFLMPYFVDLDLADVMTDMRTRAMRFDASGSRRISSSGFPSMATSRRAACTWNCGRRWSPGMSWVKRAPRAAPCGMSMPRWRAAGEGERSDLGSLRGDLQWPGDAHAAHGAGGGIRGRGTLSRVAAFVGAASDHRGACAADLRFVRFVDESIHGRMPVPCGASGRPQSRDFPGQLLRGREPALARFLRMGHTPGAMAVQPAVVDREFPFTLDLRK
jgi:hypothetical protein